MKRHLCDLTILAGLGVVATVLVVSDRETARRWVQDLEDLWSWMVGTSGIGRVV